MSNSEGSAHNGPFHRIPSESSLVQKKNGDPKSPKQPNWERSQSALDLENKDKYKLKPTALDFDDGGKVSEHSKVYWDLSQAEDEMAASRCASGGKFKISLQTIHQKEEMQTRSSPSVSIQARVVRRMASETSLLNSQQYAELCLPSSPPKDDYSSAGNTPSPSASSASAEFTFFYNQGKPNLTVSLAKAVPMLQENIKELQESDIKQKCQALDNMLVMIESAWATPTIGRDLAYGLCDVLRNDGGLDLLINNCTDSNSKVKLGSAKVLEQSMTVGNRDKVAKEGLEVVVSMAKAAKDDTELTKVTTGILESLFKHSEDTCAKVIRSGGLDSILYSCRNSDTMILRHCAEALANLAIYCGSENQYEMMSHKAADWLFPLAFCNDDNTRYYAFLAISALSANKEIETAVAKSGTLELVKPFILTHDPADFAHSDQAHIHGQSKDWLRRLVPLLESEREEAQSLAAFHFAMEAGIKAEQGKQEIFSDIGAIEPLKKLACGTNKLASKFAVQALQILGEQVPYTLSQQVPLWSPTDVKHWLQQAMEGGDLPVKKLRDWTVEDVQKWLQESGFEDFAPDFEETHVDGDLLLLLNEDHLLHDLKMENGITRKRFMRDLTKLKITADYQSCDPTKLDEWLTSLGDEFSQYSYQMLKSGADKRMLRYLTEEHLKDDCKIDNGIHRMKIMEAAKRLATLPGDPVCDTDGLDRPIDVFISYRRSNGSQLASLLKVHLQLRGFTVFLDIEKLRAGKFDDNLLNSVRNARHFILVLTPNSLDRCVNDNEQKDWVHREVVAAIEGGCNIIPVMDTFQWPCPETLPEDMRPICYFNGISWVHDYQEACISKLEQFMGTETPYLLCAHSNSAELTSSSKHSSPTAADHDDDDSKWIHDYQDACVDKLEQFLMGEAPPRPSLSKGSSLNTSTELHGPMYRTSSTPEGALSPEVMSS